jgi:hypothetical protein
MFTHTMQQSVVHVVATAAAQDAGTLNTTGIIGFIVSKIVPILLAVVGVIILSRSGKGQWSQALTTGGIAVLGIFFIAGATLLFAFGESLAKLALGG